MRLASIVNKKNRKSFVSSGIILAILFVVLVGVLTPNIVLAQAGPGSVALAATGPVGLIANILSEGETFAEQVSKLIGWLLMTISAGILSLAGVIFDKVIEFTIRDMAKNIGAGGALADGINISWATLRDIANMCFIFVLLFAAFKAMFSLSFSSIGTTIKNVIIVALLINFSLFFSKVVIDASNVVAVGFYNSITTSQSTFNTTNVNNAAINTQLSGISAGYMNLLGMQKWYDSKILESGMKFHQVLIVGIMSSIFMLIVSVIFLISAIMFLARFIILIFLMILSPLALIAYIIPGMQGKFDEWKEALINQSFFAPLFFALTWVVFKLGKALAVLGTDQNASYVKMVTESPSGSASLLLNYVLIIGFSIAALVISKQMASKTAGFSAISGGMMAGAGLIGRNTIGRGSRALLNSEKLRNMASDKDRSWAARTFAKSTLWTSKKGAEGSFDLRGMGDTKLSKAVGGGEMFKGMGSAGGKGGFEKAVKDKAEAKAKYAKEVYGQTAKEKEKLYLAEDAVAIHEEKRKAEEEAIRAERNKLRDEAQVAQDDADKDLKEKELVYEEIQKNKKLGNRVDKADAEKALKEVESARLKLKIAKEKHSQAIEKAKAKIEDGEYSKEVQALKEEATARQKAWDEVKNAGKERQKTYAERVGSGIFGWGVGSQEAMRKIKEQARDKSDAQKFAELAKKLAKEEADAEKEKE